MNMFKKPKEEIKQQPQAAAPAEKEIPADELNAAIATALYLYRQEVHDYENYVLTIKRIEKRYSPWSSKIYSLRKWPGGGSY